MTIGNALFAQLSISRFNRLDADLAEVQGRIASGVNDPRASADTGRAAQLSAVRDQQTRLSAYLANADTAGARLSLTDTTLGAMSDVMRQVRQIALEAASTATATGGEAIHADQLSELRKSLIGLANSRDNGGFPLFSGLSGDTPFVEGPGGVDYRGDTGQTLVQMSESRRMETGISGAAALMAVRTADGPHSVFGMIDDLMSGLTTLAGSVAQTEIGGSARLVPATGAAGDLALTLAGPAGEASIRATPATPEGLAAAINASSAQTGITATPDTDSGGVVITAAGGIALSGLAAGDGAGGVLAVLTPLEGSAPPVRLRPADKSDAAILSRLDDALDHLAGQRGRVGAMASGVDALAERLNARKVAVDKAEAGLNDLDLAAASTRLAALMTQQQAAMQTYSMITGKTLFDFIG